MTRIIAKANSSDSYQIEIFTEKQGTRFLWGLLASDCFAEVPDIKQSLENGEELELEIVEKASVLD